MRFILVRFRRRDLGERRMDTRAGDSAGTSQLMVAALRLLFDGQQERGLALYSRALDDSPHGTTGVGIHLAMLEQAGQKDCANGFILDGYPRSLTQAKALDVYLKKAGSLLDGVIYFKAEPNVVIARMGQRRICSSCGATFNLISQPSKKLGICDRCGSELITRTDDFPEATVRKRLKIYEETTSPLLTYYQDHKVLIVINAAQPVDVIAREVASFCGLD